MRGGSTTSKKGRTKGSTGSPGRRTVVRGRRGYTSRYIPTLGIYRVLVGKRKRAEGTNGRFGPFRGSRVTEEPTVKGREQIEVFRRLGSPQCDIQVENYTTRSREKHLLDSGCTREAVGIHYARRMKLKLVKLEKPSYVRLMDGKTVYEITHKTRQHIAISGTNGRK